MQSKKPQKNKNKTKNKTKKADTFFSEIFSKNLFQFQCSVLVERVLQFCPERFHRDGC